METCDNEIESTQECRDSLSYGTFSGDTNVSVELYNSAEKVRLILDDINLSVEQGKLAILKISVEEVEELMEALKSFLKQRRTTQMTRILANAAKTLVYIAEAFFRIVFLIGYFIRKMIGTISSAGRNNEFKRLATASIILEKGIEDFPKYAEPLSRMDKVLQDKTGWSIYDEAEFQEFLTCAAESPDRIDEKVPVYVTPKSRNIIIGIAQNRELISLLQLVYDGIRSEPFMVFQVMIQVLCAFGAFRNAIAANAELPFCELAVRGLEIFLDYKNDRITLQEFKDAVLCMRKEYNTLQRASKSRT